MLSPGQVSVLLYPLALLKKWITKLLAFRGTSPIASCVVDVSVQALGERCFPKAPNLAYQLACTWACKDALYLISLVPRPSPAPVFDRLQYAKTEPEGLVNLTT